MSYEKSRNKAGDLRIISHINKGIKQDRPAVTGDVHLLHISEICIAEKL